MRDCQGNGAGMNGTGRGMTRERVGLAGDWPGKEWEWQRTGPGKRVTVKVMAYKCHEMGRGQALPPVGVCGARGV